MEVPWISKEAIAGSETTDGVAGLSLKFVLMLTFCVASASRHITHSKHWCSRPPRRLMDDTCWFVRV